MRTRWKLDGAPTRALLMAVAALSLLGLAGCGEDSGKTSGPSVDLHITRDFGRESLSTHDDVPVPKPANVLRLLKDHQDVGMDGDSVKEIDGLAAEYDKPEPNGHSTTWANFINGVETDGYPKELKLRAGDIVQWDLRDWYVTFDVRAIVGAFPETFTQGFERRPIPVRVLCEDPSATACSRVKRTLRAAGVKIGIPKKAVFKGRVLVGSWNHWRDNKWPHQLDRGPRYSGVFAQFNRAGDELDLLDWNGRPIRTETGDVGLVAGTRPTEFDFVWMITGTSAAGVERAAQALDPERLRDAFALVVTPDGDERVPLEEPEE
jgi:hypothetical protein